MSAPLIHTTHTHNICIYIYIAKRISPTARGERTGSPLFRLKERTLDDPRCASHVVCGFGDQ